MSEDRERLGLLGDSSTSNKEASRFRKVVRTVPLIFLWICFGAFCEVTGPVLPELIAQTHSSYTQVTRALSMRGAGHAVGGIIAGLTVDRCFSRIDLLTGLAIVLYVLAGMWCGYVTTITSLFMAFLAQGTLETWLNTAGTRIALNLWQGKASASLHGMQIGYGIGSLISPKIASPFLDSRLSGSVLTKKPTLLETDCLIHDDSPSNITGLLFRPVQIFNQTVDLNSSTLSSMTIIRPELKYPADYIYAYWILAVASLPLACVFIGYYFFSKAAGDRSENHKGEENSNISKVSQNELLHSMSPRSCSPGNPLLTSLIVSTLFFYNFVSVPLGRMFAKLIFSYLRDGACFSVSEATSLQSLYFCLLTLGRVAAFGLSACVHAKYIMKGTVLGIVTCSIVLYIYPTNHLVLWIACLTLGFFTGPLIPSAFAVTNHYIELTSMVQMVPMFGAAIGDVVFMYSVGMGYENIGPTVIWTYQLAFALALCVVSVVMLILCHIHGDRFEKVEKL